MKNALKGLFFLLLLLVSSYYVKAESYYVNNNDIQMTAAEYDNLLNLGFTENEIQNMKLEEFNNNKDLIGEVVSKKTVFIPTEDTLYNRYYHVGYVETVGKKLTTTIVSVNNKYRYKVTLEWKVMPSTRSYDILGIGMYQDVTISSSLYFQSNYCYSPGNCSSNGVNTQKVTSTGATVIYKLPSATVVSMDSYLYFDVSKNVNYTITQLDAAGDYSHATSTISLNNAKNHTIDAGGIHLNSSISGYYDSMPTALATLTCSW